MIKEHDIVALVRDLPERGLKQEQIGVVVMVHDSVGYEVEFVGPNGKPISVVALSADFVRPASTGEVFEFSNACLFQRRVAEIAITASLARNQGFAGAVETLRRFAAKIDLSEFALQQTEPDFVCLLDRRTAELQQALKDCRAEKADARADDPDLWGLARKALNVFLCEAFFHRILHRCYGLQTLGPWLEVPLDSQTYTSIRRKAYKLGLRGRRDDLPFKFSIGGLSKDASKRAQELAKRIAEKEHLPLRIYLEIATWRASGAETKTVQEGVIPGF